MVGHDGKKITLILITGDSKFTCRVKSRGYI